MHEPEYGRGAISTQTIPERLWCNNRATSSKSTAGGEALQLTTKPSPRSLSIWLPDTETVTNHIACSTSAKLQITERESSRRKFLQMKLNQGFYCVAAF